MPRFDPVQTDFTAGEISPKLMGNFQIDKYKKGVKTLENMLVQPHGGVSRRGGFKYVAEVKDSSKTTVLHSFKYKDEFSYTLEFGDLYIRFYRNQAQIMDNGSPYEVVTTYAEAELQDLRIAQDEETFYIVHKNHLPAQLTRTAHDSWTLANIVFTDGGVATVNTFVEPSHAWTSQVSAKDNQWASVCWSPELELFCAVSESGSNNRIMTSPDGVTWTARVGLNNDWSSVCWSPELSLFCAVASVGALNRVMTSPDGIAWTLRVAASVQAWESVCWSPELTLFVAVASDGVVGVQVMTSPDGTTWTSRTSSEANAWREVCWSADLTLFCAVSSTGTNRVMTSPDGTTWTARSEDPNDAEYYSVCWSSALTLFCAVAFDGEVMTSPDGTTWTERTPAESNRWRSVCWSPELGLFIAVSSTGTNRVMSSINGTAWTARAAAAANSWYGVCWSAKLHIFCAVSVSGSGDRAMTGYAGLKNGTYTDVELEDGSGSGVIATVVVASNVLSTITPTTEGKAYLVDDTLSIEPTDIGGSEGDITCDVLTISTGDIPSEWVATNYPTLCWFFEQRMWFASTPDEANQVWGSRTGNYFNLYIGDGLDSEGLDILIKDATKILWVTTSEVILLGANNGVFRLSANNLNEAITPTNIRAPKIVSYGSAFLPAIDIDGNPVFIQRGLRKVRRLEYDSKRDRYKAIDLNILSDHITKSGITDVAYSNEPNSFIWGVRTDGELVCMTYEPEYGVFGWDRHTIGGTDVVVKNVAVSDAITADEDELWIIVSRTIDSATVQYVEFLTPGLTAEDVIGDAFFIDSGVTKTGSGFTTFDGLDHLEGEAVYIFVDGAGWDTGTVSSGEVTCSAADKAHAGLKFTSVVETLPLEGGNPIGSAMGKIKRISSLVLRLYRSYIFSLSDLDETQTEVVTVEDTSGGAIISLFTGDTEELDFYGDHESGGQIRIEIENPIPFTLLAIMYKARTGE